MNTPDNPTAHKEGLMPCPFCGDVNVCHTERIYVETRPTVRCRGCEAQVWAATEKEAHEKWNTRQ